MNNPYPHRIDPDISAPRNVPRRATVLGVVLVLLAFCAAGIFLLWATPGSELLAYSPTYANAVVNTVSGNAQRITVAANGKSVTVSGNGNTVTVTGDCPVLTVRGNSNRVSVEIVGKIVISGNANRAYWKAAHEWDVPTITTSGNANTVEKQDESN
ncbi:MAG: DUF3060 domain-containing protein [Armatimonadetes bacterium]|nr:DUF3060 domain-containing protein [Armatimonadota bacterium]